MYLYFKWGQVKLIIDCVTYFKFIWYNNLFFSRHRWGKALWVRPYLQLGFFYLGCAVLLSVTACPRRCTVWLLVKWYSMWFKSHTAIKTVLAVKSRVLCVLVQSGLEDPKAECEYEGLRPRRQKIIFLNKWL